MQDGYGIETWADGSRYEGYYKAGKKHGNGNFTKGPIHNFSGTYTWADGSKYVGNWVENKISGFVNYLLIFINVDRV